MSETELAERLGATDVGDQLSVALADGTTFEGPASPVDYVPEESLRIEIRPEGGTTDRYELRADYDGEWSDVSVRHADPTEDDDGWESLGTVEHVEVSDDEDE
jgi:hypothetical protein